MKNNVKNRINRQVSRAFPEMKGVKPSVKQQNNGSQPQYLLVYKGKAELPGGRSLNRIVRVVADESGSILRMSTSR